MRIDDNFNISMEGETDINVELVPLLRRPGDPNVTSAKAVPKLSAPPEESILSFARDNLEVASSRRGSSSSVSSELLALLPANARPRRVLN